MMLDEAGPDEFGLDEFQLDEMPGAGTNTSAVGHVIKWLHPRPTSQRS